MYENRRTTVSRQPSLYPPLVFHLIRAGQFLSSAIVLSILSFFIHYLHLEQFSVPWTFILLITVSILTICSLVATGILHNLRTLSPTINIPVNTINTTLWAVGFALLTWNISPLLRERCTQATWRDETGIMVCRMYKALASFTITGFVSAALTLLVDLHTRLISTRRGTYDPMLDEKTPFPNTITPHISSPDPYQNRGVSQEVSRPYKVQRPFEAGQFGYSAPSEQTTYDGGVGGSVCNSCERIVVEGGG